MRNAAESIPRGMPHVNGISIRTRLTGEGRISIEIADTRVGVAAADIPYVFDPFFTTKPHESSPGLGLAAARAAIDEMGGSIAIDSVVGRGSRVRVALPPAEIADERDRDPALFVERTLPPRRVLCVADDPVEARRLGSLFDDGDAQMVYATCDEALFELSLGAHYDIVLCHSHTAARDELRARVRRQAPAALSRIFAVTPPPRESGTFAHAEVVDALGASAE